jgi:uncharacterized protein YcfL
MTLHKLAFLVLTTCALTSHVAAKKAKVKIFEDTSAFTLKNDTDDLVIVDVREESPMVSVYNKKNKPVNVVKKNTYANNQIFLTKAVPQASNSLIKELIVPHNSAMFLTRADQIIFDEPKKGFQTHLERLGVMFVTIAPLEGDMPSMYSTIIDLVPVNGHTYCLIKDKNGTPVIQDATDPLQKTHLSLANRYLFLKKSDQQRTIDKNDYGLVRYKPISFEKLARKFKKTK